MEMNDYLKRVQTNLVVDDKITLKNEACSYINVKNPSFNNMLFLLIRTVMEVFCVLRMWTVLMMIVSVSAYGEQRFALEPQDQSAVLGSRVILPCRVESKSGQLQWTKDDFGLGTHRHLLGYERYKMVGSDEEGDYSLDIRDVSLDDDAMYQCQVSTGLKGEPAIRSRYARLTVLVPPDPPKILRGPVLQTVEDRDVDLECVSVGGKPAAEITWVDNEGGVLSQGVTYTVEEMSDGRRFTARSTLRLRPRRSHHNQTFTCQAQNTADRAYKSAVVRLKVQFAPRVRIAVKSSSSVGRIQEGDTVTLNCQAAANPSNMTFIWYVNSERMVDAKSHEMIISNISRSFNSATIRCEVHNIVGRSSETKTLEIVYGPSFRTRPQNVEGELGTSVTLSCLVEGHPQPKITWLRYDQDKAIRVGKTSNLTLTVTTQSAGQYWCRASIDGRTDIEAAAVVYLKGPPKIISNETQYGVEGDSVRIECTSFSVPKPSHVIWAYQGNEINSFHNQEYVFLEESLADRLTKSTLIVRNSAPKHFGVYNCTVINDYGTDTAHIVLMRDKSASLLLITCGASSVAILVLIIMLVTMLCHRKNNKCDVKKPDIDDMKSDRNSNVSDLKFELRQVEGSCEMDTEELHPTLQLTTNLGLPLAGPVPLPEPGYDMKYQRYSGDFTQINMPFKPEGSINGYVPYVDYARDYAPPSSDSLTGSMSRNTDVTYQSHCGSLHRQKRLGAMVGPDLIPMPNPTQPIMMNGMDVRYAATYGNPYLTATGPQHQYPQQQNTSSKNAPPPYYTLKSISSHPTANSMTSSSSRPINGQPDLSMEAVHCQVPSMSPQNSSRYILPQSNQGLSSKLAAKGIGSSATHV
ncbi:irregular chiasm C-roughest protein-like [Leptidea sinapis]|uniref:irregular chiasm C-roughest protein-like n=1 Tax=Leptidea sinapis TaxID=189913 RepID=UPI00212E6DEA|nr:irregular chiasm C-roughest protein-like [Leptidea sinapis]